MSKIFSTVLCVGALISGAYFGVSAKQGSIVEYFSDGTLKGLNACVTNTSSTALSDIDVRSVCASRHAKDLSVRVSVEGVGSPVEVQAGRFSFNGTMTNMHQGYLVTFAQVSLNVFNEEGVETIHVALGNIWATPFDEISVELPFSRQLPDEAMSLEWCDRDIPDDERKSCKGWRISHIAGVSI